MASFCSGLGLLRTKSQGRFLAGPDLEGPLEGLRDASLCLTDAVPSPLPEMTRQQRRQGGLCGHLGGLFLPGG